MVVSCSDHAQASPEGQMRHLMPQRVNDLPEDMQRLGEKGQELRSLE